MVRAETRAARHCHLRWSTQPVIRRPVRLDRSRSACRCPPVGRPDPPPPSAGPACLLRYRICTAVLPHCQVPATV